MSSGIPDFVTDLLDPEVYPDKTLRVEMRQTHLSWLFLTDRFVYKVKKAVNLGFLDFSQAAVRRDMCVQEVALNSRLSPGVYLGVVPVFSSVHGCSLRRQGEQDRVVDWAVKMRRLPEERSLEAMGRSGKLTGPIVDALAERLADFHAWSPHGAEVARWAQPGEVARLMRENLQQMQVLQAHGALPPGSVERQQRSLQDFLGGDGYDVLSLRALHRRFCDGHGDLRLEHIFLMPSWAFEFIDCIEFSPRYRCGDMAGDVAFTVMDLIRHRRRDLSERFIAAYAKASDDYDLYRVIDFYTQYRALVRAKIECIRSSDEQAHPTRRREAARTARQYMQLADFIHDRPPNGMLLSMAGLIGSGKTTLALTLSRKLNIPLLTLDSIRKRMVGRPPAVNSLEPFEQGIYTKQFTDQVYGAMLEKAEQVLRSGRSVILDASFRKESHRNSARSMAAQLGAPFLLLECSCPRPVLLHRLQGRIVDGKVVNSDAREDILDLFIGTWEPPLEIPRDERLLLDCSRSPSALMGDIIGRLRRAGLEWT